MDGDDVLFVSFEVVGYGCMTCIGNSGPLPEPVVEAISQVNTAHLSCNCACYESVSVFEYHAITISLLREIW